MEKKYQKFFLGANSCEGFVSAFADSFDAKDGWHAYIIKGGPGTGKSSFMRHFALHATKKNTEAILCPCSSDPDSLDAVILPEYKIAMLDGTAPHVVEPEWPGLCEEIVNPGEYWDASKLAESAEEIFEVSNENSRLHRKAAGYLKAAGQVLADDIKLASLCTDKARCEGFALKLCKKLLPKCKKQNGKEWVRFLQGVTPLGVISYTDTINDFYENKVIISDPYGAVGNIFMQTVRAYALQAGYEIITVKNAFMPSKLTDHILIPALSLAFVTESGGVKFGGTERRIHARRFMDVARLHSYRQRMLFNRRIAGELISTACESIRDAKAVHDKLEKYYISAMDFEALTEFAEEFVRRVL